MKIQEINVAAAFRSHDQTYPVYEKFAFFQPKTVRQTSLGTLNLLIQLSTSTLAQFSYEQLEPLA